MPDTSFTFPIDGGSFQPGVWHRLADGPAYLLITANDTYHYRWGVPSGPPAAEFGHQRRPGEDLPVLIYEDESFYVYNPHRPFRLCVLQREFNGSLGSGGGASVAEVIAALVAAVGEGNALLVEGGEIVGLPIVDGAVATSWDLLVDLADGLSDQGVALKAWQEARRAGAPIAGGVATFDWPQDVDGARNRTGYVRWTVGPDDDDAGVLSWAIAERAAEIATIEQVLTLTLEIVNNTGATLTVQPAAAAAGREPATWGDGVANPSIANGAVLRVHVNAYADRCIGHPEIPDA
jgi:hypothetical protein